MQWRTVELAATKWSCPTPTHEFHLIMVQRLGTCICCSCGVVLSVRVPLPFDVFSLMRTLYNIVHFHYGWVEGSRDIHMIGAQGCINY
jgi:hypothetical protein